MAGREPEVMARRGDSNGKGGANAGEDAESSGYTVGHGKPPLGSRFRSGQSGNPKGRPKGSKKKELPFEAVCPSSNDLEQGA